MGEDVIPQSARFRNWFFRKRTKISHRVGTVLIVFLFFFHPEFKFNRWRKTLHFKASWQDDDVTRGSM